MEDLFVYSNVAHTRGHNKKSFKLRSRLDIRKFFFSQRVVDEWNCLPSEVVNCKSLIEFKSRIDPMFKRVRGIYTSQKRLPSPVLRPASREGN